MARPACSRYNMTCFPFTAITCEDCSANTAPDPDTCEWTPDDDGVFDTDCGNRFEFNVGGPAENGCRFCPYCGEPIAECLTQNEA